MSSAESVHNHFRLDPRPLFYSALGIIGVAFINARLHGVSYEGINNITSANEKLKKGGNLLIASDHPETLLTIDAAGLVPRLNARSKEFSAALAKYELVSGKTVLSNMILKIFSHYKITPFPVKTPKHCTNEYERASFNRESTRECLRLLQNPSSLLLIFASGTRSRNMQEAEDGLGFFSPKVNAVVPLTSVNKNGQSHIIIHEPIPGKIGTKWCTGRFGKETGRQTFSDLVMTIIASGQPDEEKRGFYKEHCAVLEKYLDPMNPFKERTILQSQNQRARRVVEAYIAWTQGWKSA